MTFGVFSSGTCILLDFAFGDFSRLRQFGSTAYLEQPRESVTVQNLQSPVHLSAASAGLLGDWEERHLGNPVRAGSATTRLIGKETRPKKGAGLLIVLRRPNRSGK
jgi:hypothetical protein